MPTVVQITRGPDIRCLPDVIKVQNPLTGAWEYKLHGPSRKELAMTNRTAAHEFIYGGGLYKGPGYNPNPKVQMKENVKDTVKRFMMPGGTEDDVNEYLDNHPPTPDVVKPGANVFGVLGTHGLGEIVEGYEEGYNSPVNRMGGLLDQEDIVNSNGNNMNKNAANKFSADVDLDLDDENDMDVDIDQEEQQKQSSEPAMKKQRKDQLNLEESMQQLNLKNVSVDDVDEDDEEALFDAPKVNVMKGPAMGKQNMHVHGHNPMVGMKTDATSKDQGVMKQGMKQGMKQQAVQEESEIDETEPSPSEYAPSGSVSHKQSMMLEDDIEPEHIDFAGESTEQGEGVLSDDPNKLINSKISPNRNKHKAAARKSNTPYQAGIMRPGQAGIRRGGVDLAQKGNRFVKKDVGMANVRRETDAAIKGKTAMGFQPFQRFIKSIVMHQRVKELEMRIQSEMTSRLSPLNPNSPAYNEEVAIDRMHLFESLLSSDKAGFKMKYEAMRALHEAFECYMIGILEDCNACAQHCKRKTVMAKDLQLTMRIRGESTNIYGEVDLQEGIYA